MAQTSSASIDNTDADFQHKETSQYHASGHFNINGSSQLKSSHNFQMEEQHKSRPITPADYGFPSTQGYTGLPITHQLTSHAHAHAHANLILSHHRTNASHNPMSPDISQYLLNSNMGRTQFNPNQESDESSTIMPKVNMAGNSERAFQPPINTYHNQLGSTSFSSPGLDTSLAFTTDCGTSSNFANLGHHESPFNSKIGIQLGPSYGFQWPTVGDQNNHLRHINQIGRSMVVPSIPIVDSKTMPCESRQRRVDGQSVLPLSIGMVTHQSPSEILPQNNGNFSSRSFLTPPLVMDTRSTRVQNPSSHNGESHVVGSIQQSSSLPRQHSTFDQAIQTVKENRSGQVSRPPIISSVKRPASEPLPYTMQQVQRMKTVPTQSFIHQSVPTWTRLAPSVPNTPQPIPPPLIHRPAQSPTLQATQSSVSPLLPYTLSLPNTTQAIAPTIPPAPSLPAPIDMRTSSFRHSSHPPLLPSQQQLVAQFLARQQTTHQHSVSVLRSPPLANQQLVAQSLTRQHTPLRPPLLPNQQLAAPSLARQHTAPRPPALGNQQLAAAHPLARQHTRLRPPPSITTGSYIKYKDERAEGSGYKCVLCKRDVSYGAEEGPISQAAIPPTVAVLSCGHTFHEYCLERITPDDQSKDPPCIPCALLE